MIPLRVWLRIWIRPDLEIRWWWGEGIPTDSRPRPGFRRRPDVQLATVVPRVLVARREQVIPFELVFWLRPGSRVDLVIELRAITG
jgi:hypothetical protein